MSISPVLEIVEELRNGRMVVLVDEEDRENEGDLVMAADFVTPDAINFMAKYGRGLICLTLTEKRCRELGLKPMVTSNGTSFGTNFTASIEAAEGVTTGISAADRAHTIRVAVNKNAKPDDLVQPGHVFPLSAVNGGVLCAVAPVLKIITALLSNTARCRGRAREARLFLADGPGWFHSN